MIDNDDNVVETDDNDDDNDSDDYVTMICTFYLVDIHVFDV